MRSNTFSVLLFVALTTFCPLAGTAEARDIWVHAVGIDTQDPTQNMTSFYQSGADFLKACHTSTRKPECHLFIDTNPKLAASPKGIETLRLTPNEGVATPTKVLDFIRLALNRIGSKDQLIISLIDHGSPSLSLSGNSCVYFGLETICDNDLTSILKDNPNKVQIFVMADGCYTGAFTNVVKTGACAFVGSDQLHAGMSDRPTTWKLINEAPEKIITQLKVPTEGGTVPRLSSQLIMRSLCKDARTKLENEDNILDGLWNLGKMRVVENYDESTPKRLYNYTKISSKLADIVQLLSKFSCDEMNIPKAACDAKMRIQNDKSGHYQKYFSQLDHMFFRAYEINVEIESLMTHKLDGINQNVATAVELIEKEDVDPKFFDDSPPKELAEIRRIIKELLPVKTLQAEQKLLWAEMPAQLHKFQKTTSYQDWITVYECLLPDHFDEMIVGFSYPENSQFWNDIARRSTPLRFTETDYESALQCENQIKF